MRESKRIKLSTKSKGKVPIGAGVQLDIPAVEDEAFDDTRFRSAAAAKICIGDLSRKLAHERGIAYCEFPFENDFDNFGWAEFAKDRQLPNESLVREFYANANECSTNYSWVRGKRVCYSPAAINLFYGKQGPIDISRFTKLSDNTDWDLVLQRLRLTDSVDWERNKKGAPNCLMERNLSRDAKALNRFLCASLLPTTHISKVFLDRCLTIFAILSGIEIDIGKTIRREIGAVLERKQERTCLFFPNLITDLCVQAGVEFVDSEQRVATRSMIKSTDAFLKGPQHLIAFQQRPNP